MGFAKLNTNKGKGTAALTFYPLKTFRLASFFDEEWKQFIMKKILTLLLATGTFVSVNAQSKEDARRVILGGGNGSTNDRNYPSNGGRDVILGGDGNNNGSYPTNNPNSYPSGNAQYQIDQVNREYDVKIQSIRNNGYLSYDEKQRAIRQLEKDRQSRLQQINSQYNNSYGKNNRQNNGKHKGWDKKSKNKNWKKGNNNRDWDDD